MLKKAFDTILQPFVIKTLSKVGVRGSIPQYNKDQYEKLTANIILSGQKLKLFPLRSGTRQGCHFYLSYSTTTTNNQKMVNL